MALNPLKQVSTTVGASSGPAWDCSIFCVGRTFGRGAKQGVLEVMEDHFSVENYEKEAWEVGCHRESIIWVL